MTRSHQIPVLSHVKAQKRPEHIAKDLALQHTMATLQNSERGTTMCIMPRIDHRNHLTTVIPGGDIDHHHLTTEGDTPGDRQ